MMLQEDVEFPAMPKIVAVLYTLQLLEVSVNLDRHANQLNVFPAPTTELAAEIKEFYDELKFMKPGICDACKAWHLRRHDAYWGANPYFCAKCLLRITAYFDKHGEWPEPHFNDL